MSAPPLRHILGVSAYYHDSAAALVTEGEIVAAAQEERFSRRKNDENFPANAVKFCLDYARLRPSDLSAVVFYDKPIVKFARMLETWLAIAPSGLSSFLRTVPNWLGERLNLRAAIREEVPGLAPDCPVLFSQHHQAHAASAFFPSPFSEAAILTVDGVGEYATTTVGRGRAGEIEILREMRFPHSLGLLYSSFTAYCGFRVNSGEYKLMGLAPYGEPRHANVILDHLLDLKPDGSFRLNLEYFDFLKGERMTADKFHNLFGGPPRAPESPLEPRHLDVARSIQAVTEEVMLRLARHAREITGQRHLCLAGGVALNCVANGKLLQEKIFDRLWIQPAAGDAGGALGAALALWHNSRAGALEAAERPVSEGRDGMKGALLGPEFTPAQIRETLLSYNAVYELLSDEEVLARTARLLSEENVVGWVQGRMEFGPRALGNRSILGDPRSPRMQSVMNLKVKFRESFRPFAPVVLREKVSDYFEMDAESPYMLLVAPVRINLRLQPAGTVLGLDRLKQVRSTLPAVTHVDYSARIQTVARADNPRLYSLIEAFEKITGCAVLVNTSFNVRGEPVVCSPDDAYRCFINTEMDYLVLGNYLLKRSEQPHKTLERRGSLALD